MKKPWYDASILGEPLTKRQAEVIELMCLGKTNKEIGQILGCSPLTAKNHTMSVRRKLGAANRTYAVALWVEKKLKG